MSIKEYFNQKVMYGGEICRLGDVYLDLQKITSNQRLIDIYICGLLRNNLISI